MQKLLPTFVSWLPLAIAVTGLSLLSYVLVQQNYRQELNDPQIEMARDAADRIERGAALESAIPPGLVMMESSLAPWIAVVDMQGRPLIELEDTAEGEPDVSFVASSGLLNRDLYQIPAGIFEFAAQYGESRLTWQPAPEVRQAIVVVAIDGSNYFVVAGRNTSESEMRVQQAGHMTTLIWLALLLSTFAAKYVAVHVAHRRRS